MTAATRSVRIARIRDEAVGVRSFELVDPDGRPLPAFTAGAHVDVHPAPGLVRQYSLCNDPSETHRYLIGVLHAPQSRGGSAAMHRLAEGQVIGISDPRNHFPLAAGAAHSLLLAGGIGITPLWCMAQRLAAEGASFELHYCTRSPERTAFADRLREACCAGRVYLHHDDGDAGQRLDAGAVMAAMPPGTHLYVCGPAGFMEAMLAAARRAGWPEDRLHREYFAAAPAGPREAGAFEVVLAASGRVVTVLADRSVVQALAAAGVDVPTSCEQGVCGTCLTRVIDGTPDHRDLFLTPDEQARGDQFTPCCSRSLGPRLVLDL